AEGKVVVKTAASSNGWGSTVSMGARTVAASLPRMRPIQAQLLSGEALFREVVLHRLAQARESVWISTANVKAMLVPNGAGGSYRPIVALFSELAGRGVELRILHAELPSRPFRAAFDARRRLVRGGLELKICPRVHFKCVLVDGAWVYLGSANLTGAGLGAKHADKRNFELGFVTEDFDTIDQVTALYQSVWKGAECGACRVRELCPDPIGPAAGPPGRRGPRRPEGIVLGRPRRLGRG
ncbi:MAG: phospholipase D family protein, partial [Myxococcaceae bacterium]